MKHILTLLICLFCFNVFSQNKGTGLLPLDSSQEKALLKSYDNFIGSSNNVYRLLLDSYGDQNSSKFDLRDVNGITEIKDQYNCGSCWAFSILASMESSNLLINKKKSDLSEQQLVNCVSVSKGCNGGWPEQALQWLVENGKGFISEKEKPYMNNEGSCSINPDSPIKIANWGSLGRFPSIEKVKKAIVQHGALIAAVNSGSDKFKRYKSGVLDTPNTGQISHGIVVTGWDDEKQAWLIKNSWGLTWGEKGYAWVKYGKLDISYFTWVDVNRLDESYEAPKYTDEDKYVLNISSILGSIQEYQNIGVSIDGDKKVLKFGMNKKKVKYNNKIRLTPGTHKIQIFTYSKIAKGKKRATISGASNQITVVMNEDKSFKMSYGKKIKAPNYFFIKLEEEK